MTILFLFTLLVGAYMAWNVGANDVANAMGTSVGSGALNFKRAIVAAGVFEFIGAVLVGTHVTNTVRSGIVDAMAFSEQIDLFALGMFAALLAAALWLHIASFFGLPVSTTHSIVGAIFGFGLVFGGVEAISWDKMIKILLSWVISPLSGGLISWGIFRGIRKIVFESADPLQQTRKVAPFLISVVFGVLSLSFLYKGLKNLHLDLPIQTALVIAGCVGLGSGTITYLLTGRENRNALATDQIMMTERFFRNLQVITACYVAFAHGANDVANAIGPIAAVKSIYSSGTISKQVPVPLWILLLGGSFIVFGLAMYGKNVMQTIGKNITEMTPTRGFSAEFGAATTVLLCSKLGLPISTTHTLVGSVIGVGVARGITTLDLRVVRNIAASWLITIPATSVIAILIFLAGRQLF